LNGKRHRPSSTNSRHLNPAARRVEIEAILARDDKALLLVAAKRADAEPDRRTGRQLRRLEWRVLTVWECSTRDREKLLGTLKRFLAEKHSS
jgi:hypothetical protein